MAKRGKMNKARRLDWKRLLIGILFLIFVLIIFLQRLELQQIVDLLKNVRVGWLFVAILAQFAVFAFSAGLYKAILGKGKKEKSVSFFYLFKTIPAMIFVDHAVPSFSASGNVLLYYVTRKKKISQGKASLLIGLNLFINFFFYFIILIIGVIYLFASKETISPGLVWIFALTIVSFIIINRILWTSSGQRHFKAIMAWLLKKWPKAKKRTLALLDNLYKTKRNMKKGQLSLCFFFGLLIYIFKIAVILFVFLALSHFINFGVLLVGYVIATVISVISYIRIGIYELAMTVAYSNLGIAQEVALTATLLYRGITFWLSMLIGFIFFRILIKKEKNSPERIRTAVVRSRASHA